MPIEGETKKEKSGKHSWYYTWLLCKSCGKGRWIQRGNEERSKRCHSCALKEKSIDALRRENSPMWRGGRTINQGYCKVMLPIGSPFSPMADSYGYVREHRLVMAKSLNRCLALNEQVHHIDGNRLNNELSNLELISPANHTLYKAMCRSCPLRAKVRQLKKELESMQQRII